MKKIISLAVMITSITLLSGVKETSAQTQSQKTVTNSQTSNDSIADFSLETTYLGSKKALEIKIRYNKISKKIVAVEKNGLKIQPDEYYKFHHYIHELEEDCEQLKANVAEAQEEMKNAQKEMKNAQQELINAQEEMAKIDLEIKKDQLLFKEVLQKFAAELTKKGYQIENKPFMMSLKNIWYFNFSNNIYLDNKRLPADITKILMDIYIKTIGIEDAASSLQISLPDGLNAEIKAIESKYK